MKCCCGSSTLGSLALVAGLVAVGFGGYNLISTGCPLGRCHEGEAAATITAAAPAKDGCCPYSNQAPTVVQTASAEGEAKACCEGKAKGEGCCGLCPEASEGSAEKQASTPATDAKDPA